MTHITNIGAGIFSKVLFETVKFAGTSFDTTAATYAADFATGVEPVAGMTTAANSFTEIPDMREAPSFGVPPSLVNVPIFGSKTSRQVQGQADPTNIEISINYVPAKWVKTALGQFVGSGDNYLFAVVLANAPPGGGALSDYPIASTGVGRVDNSITYFLGEIAAIQFTPNLTDSNQATVTIALKSDFSELKTIDA